MQTKIYDRKKAVEYAKTWALKRNPKYYNFDRLGGDCTNFISQCIFSGAPVMNHTPTFGWFYNMLNDRSPAWTGVNQLYKFLVSNKGVGPFGGETPPSQLDAGDIIQLGNSITFYHTLIVSSIISGEIFVCSHTRDTLSIPLENYYFDNARYIKILGYRTK